MTSRTVVAFMALALAVAVGACGGSSDGSQPVSAPPADSAATRPPPQAGLDAGSDGGGAADDAVDDDPADGMVPPNPSPPVSASTRFVEVTQQAGLGGLSGASFGAAWGDANADGLPDLWLGNHARPPVLLFNDGAGGFTDVTDRYLDSPSGDMHGASWADIDGNGFEDLFITAGAGRGVGEGPNLVLMNDGQRMRDRAADLGLAYPLARGRSPYWVDWNLDGRLDVFVAATARSDGQSPTTVFTQQADGTFVDEGRAVGVNSQVSNDQVVEWQDPLAGVRLLLLPSGPGVERAYQTDVLPWADVTDRFADLRTNLTKEFLVADFDGDGVEDYYLARAAEASGVSQLTPETLAVRLVAKESSEVVEISVEGVLRVDGVPAGNTLIGRDEVQPASSSFELDPGNPAFHGFPDLLSRRDTGDTVVFIAFEPAVGHWFIGALSREPYSIGMGVSADRPITVDATVFSTGVERQDRLYLMNSAGGKDEVSQVVGLAGEYPCDSVAAADFDNDGDLDLYHVCRSGALNSPNRYFENLGGGRFEELVDFGAEGTDLGRGDSSAVADYDGDGYLDILVTNGQGGAPFNDGPVQLFRNVGGDNHWLQLSLHGSTSNIHGLGAKVTVVHANGTLTRWQTPGMRRFSQDARVLHFGLGTSTSAQSVEVSWPSGRVDVYANVAADQRLTLIEGAGEQSVRP
jgi:hypothetical protein